MESYNQSFSESITSNHTEADDKEVPLFLTYISMLTTTITATIVITPAVAVFNVIWYTRQLHTKYYFFIANLLATNIATVLVKVIQEYIISILYLLDLNSDSMPTAVKWLMFAPFTILYLMNILLPITVALERMIVIAFPFRHRSIMTNKTVAGILAAMWGTSIILTMISIITVPFHIVWPLAMPYWHENILTIIAAPRLLAIICIVAANSFLYYQITVSNRKPKKIKGWEMKNRLKISGSF